MKIGLLSLSALFLSNIALADCKYQLQQRITEDLDLTYQEFDQKSNSGFRLLEKSGCYAEAATLIKSFIEKNNSKENSLYWHLAQMEGFSGNYDKAILYANKVLKPNEDLKAFPMYWNDFVLGNIAFWLRDKTKLEMHMSNIEKGLSFKPNEINLNYLKKLQKGFNSDYIQALK